VNKTGYYHSLKIWLESRPDTKFKLLVRRVNLTDPKKNQNNLVLTNFFFKKINEFLGNIEVLKNHHQSLSRLMESLNTKKIYFDGHK
jgi:hypothetical protein